MPVPLRAFQQAPVLHPFAFNKLKIVRVVENFCCKVELPMCNILGSYTSLELRLVWDSGEFCKQFSEEDKKVRDHLQVKTIFYSEA